MLNLRRVIKAIPKSRGEEPLQPLMTEWGARLDKERVLDLHPHPQFERASWMNLNGEWQYCIRPLSKHDKIEFPDHYDGTIVVPFSPETQLSGVNRVLQPNEELWYQCGILVESYDLENGNRILLHFEAVDFECMVFINGREVGRHKGAYLPFVFDITNFVGEGENVLTVRVTDPTDAGVQLRGKQKLKSGNIWYSAQSGIWQSVWMEVVPRHYLVMAQLKPDAAEGVVSISVLVNAPGEVFSAEIYDAQGCLIDATTVDPRCAGTLLRANMLADFWQLGHAYFIAQLRVPNPLLWSPENPSIYTLKLYYGEDEVSSYTAFRTVEIRKARFGKWPRFALNGKPYFVRGVLNQGYWPESLMTPPSYQAFEFDIQQMKQAGFNMMRMHVKIETDRFYYACDKMGMLVWQDMPTGGSTMNARVVSYLPTLSPTYQFSKSDRKIANQRAFGASSDNYKAEWAYTLRHMVRLLQNHPCVAAWTLFNEGWGQFKAAEAVKIVQRCDAQRPIDATSGWFDQGVGNFYSEHNYFRTLRVPPVPEDNRRAYVLSEFGGLVCPVEGHTSLSSAYGYATYDSVESWMQAVNKMLSKAAKLESKGCSGFVYTQVSDIEEEMNGILTYDRKVNKFAALSAAREAKYSEELEQKYKTEEWRTQTAIAAEETEEFYAIMRAANEERELADKKLAEEEEERRSQQEAQAGDFDLMLDEDFASFDESAFTPFDPSMYDVPQMNAYDVPQMGGYDAPQMNAYDAPQMNAYDVPQMGGYDASQMNAYDVPQASAYDVPQMSGYDIPQASAYDMPQASAYDVPQMSGYDIPQASAYDVPQAGMFDIPQVYASYDSPLETFVDVDAGTTAAFFPVRYAGEVPPAAGVTQAMYPVEIFDELNAINPEGYVPQFTPTPFDWATGNGYVDPAQVATQDEPPASEEEPADVPNNEEAKPKKKFTFFVDPK